MTGARIGIAAATAPLAAPVMMLVAFALLEGVRPSLREAMIFLGVGGIVSYSGFLLIGLPWLLLLRHLRCLRMIPVLLAGTLGGVLVFYVFIVVIGAIVGASASYEPLEVLWGASLGFGVALVFGLVSGLPARSGRDSRDTDASICS